MKIKRILVVGLLLLLGGIALKFRYDRLEEAVERKSKTVSLLNDKVEDLESEIRKMRMEVAAERETLNRILAKTGPVALVEDRTVQVFDKDGQRREFRVLDDLFGRTIEWASFLGKRETSAFLRSRVVAGRIEDEYSKVSGTPGCRYLIANTARWAPWVDRTSLVEMLETAVYHEPEYAQENKATWQGFLSGPEKTKMAEAIERGKRRARSMDTDYRVPHLPAAGIMPQSWPRGGLGRY